MINEIGSSYNFYNYQTTINQLKLQQAMSKNPDYNSYRGYVDSMQSQKSWVSDSQKSSSMNFLRNYNSTMSSVMQSANALRTSNSSGVMTSLSASSSNSDVASVTQNFKLRQKKDITLNVAQIAVAQKNSSSGANGKGIAKADMNFSISSKNGNFQFNIQATDKNGIAKTNNAMLTEAANAINYSNAGVKATVEKGKDGNSILTLESDETGTASAFTVNGKLGAAEGVQTAAQEASDAQYSITEDGVTQTYTAQSNTVQLDYGRMQADLKSAGKTSITVGTDSGRIASAISDLVDSYNKATDFLRSSVSHGSGISRQLHNFERPIASENTMERLGLSYSKDGQLTFDKETFQKSLEKDSFLTEELLSGSNGLADNLFDRASSAATANSASLINNDLEAIGNQSSVTGNISSANAKGNDTFRLMATYSRAGMFNLNNFAAVGIMMNYLA